MKKLAQSLFYLLLMILVVTSFPEQTFAQDNDSVDYDCTINVNGVQASTTNGIGQVPVAPARSFQNERSAVFPVSVTLSQNAYDHLLNCAAPNSQLQLASTTAWWNNFENQVLQPSGTYFYTTSIDVAGDYNINDVVILDVETPSSLSSCVSQTPICKRAYIRLDAASLENVNQSCDAEKDLINRTMGAIESVYTTGTPINFSIEAATLRRLIDNCRGQHVRAEIWAVETGTQIAWSNTSNGLVDLNLNYANGTAGTFRITLALLSDSGCSVTTGTDCRPFYVTRDFCVGLEGSEVACTPPTEGTTVGGFENRPYQLCTQIPNLVQRNSCSECLKKKGIWTAIGCVPQNPAQAVGVLVKIGLNIAGGVALIMILTAGFMLTTSQGEAKRVGDAKELMQSAVIGLLFIIFSVTILQYIGSDLLKIPGFGNN